MSIVYGSQKIKIILKRNCQASAHHARHYLVYIILQNRSLCFFFFFIYFLKAYHVGFELVTIFHISNISKKKKKNSFNFKCKHKLILGLSFKIQIQI